MTAPAPHGRTLRRDAAANRDRMLAAAAAAIVRDGPQVPLATIATEAGVGVATLYRRFPDRESLLDALEARSYGVLVTALDAAIAEQSTGLGMVAAFLRGSFASRAELVLPLHGAPWSTSIAVQEGRDAVRERIARIVRTGREDGTVRADVEPRAIVEFGALLVKGLPAVPQWEEAAEAQRRIFLRGISGEILERGATSSRPGGSPPGGPGPDRGR